MSKTELVYLLIVCLGIQAQVWLIKRWNAKLEGRITKLEQGKERNDT